MQNLFLEVVLVVFAVLRASSSLKMRFVEASAIMSEYEFLTVFGRGGKKGFFWDLFSKEGFM